jgi:hypothetical protein
MSFKENNFSIAIIDLSEELLLTKKSNLDMILMFSPKHKNHNFLLKNQIQ